MGRRYGRRIVILPMMALFLVGMGVAIARVGQNPVADDQVSPEGAAALVAKEAIEAREQLLIEEGRLNPAVVPDNPAASGPQEPPPDFPEGIFGKQEADFPPSLGYEFQNIWRQVIGGQYVVALAGSKIDNPAEGVLMVEVIDPQSWNHTSHVYTPPIPGPVRISEAVGFNLTLISDATGDVVDFDIASRNFD